MQNWLKQNQTFLLIAILISGIVWVGQTFKKNRAENLNAMVERALMTESKTTDTSSQVQDTSAQADLTVLSDTFNVHGQRRVLLSDKTKAQMEIESRQLEKIKQEVGKQIVQAESRAFQQSRESQQKRFQIPEFAKQLHQLDQLSHLSANERVNNYIHLRNQIYVSKTTPSEKKKMLDALDLRIESTPLPVMRGFEAVNGPEGQISLLIPRVGT